VYSVGLDTLLIAVVLAFGLGFLMGQLALVVNSARVLDALARRSAHPSDGGQQRTTPRRYVR